MAGTGDIGTDKTLNATLATLHKWAEALGQKLVVDLTSP
jgi:hypothetical protein